jgi:hypothetical protein
VDVGSDGDWVVLISLIAGTYLAWLGIVIARFKSMNLTPSELLLVPRQGHRAKQDLERVRPMAFWLALLPTIAVLAVTPKVVTMLIDVNWAKPAIASLSVLISYLFLAACAVVGWVRWIAIRRRIEALKSV